MNLLIDSTNNLLTKIRIDDKEYQQEVDSPRHQNIFGFLMRCLKEKGISISDITEIEVNPGPGSFTGTRVGVAIANALAFALKVKVNNQTPPIEPVYSSPPNITVPKSAIVN